MASMSRRRFLEAGAFFAAAIGLTPRRATAESPGAAASQPASAPATQPGDAGLRRPQQAEILKNLLRRQDRGVPLPISPADPVRTAAERGIGPDGQPLLLEGTVIVERPGRIHREGESLVFAFHLDGETPLLRHVRLLPCQLLETIEYEMVGGYQEFVLSGELTRYHGENFLLVRKVLRRLPHGNLSP